MDEVDMKHLTDRELCDKFNLPYFETNENLPNKSDSSSDFVGILSKIRQVNTEKSQPLSTTRQVFENSPISIPRRNSTFNEDTIKSPSTANIKSKFESEQSSSEQKPQYSPGTFITRKIRKNFE